MRMIGFAWKNFDTMKRGSKIKTSRGMSARETQEGDKGVQELDKVTMQMLE